MSTTKRKLTAVLPDGTTDHRTTQHDYTHVAAAARTASGLLASAEQSAAYVCRRLAQQEQARQAGGTLDLGNGCSILYGEQYVRTLRRDLDRCEAEVARYASLPADALVWFAYSWHSTEALAAKAVSNLGTFAGRQVCEVTA